MRIWMLLSTTLAFGQTKPADAAQRCLSIRTTGPFLF